MILAQNTARKIAFQTFIPTETAKLDSAPFSWNTLLCYCGAPAGIVDCTMTQEKNCFFYGGHMHAETFNIL